MARRSDPRGYYAALGVEPTASADQVRKAFTDRAKHLHPDHNTSPDAATEFQRLQEAYDVLRDARRRVQYDAEALEGDRQRRSGNPEPQGTARRAPPRPARPARTEPQARASAYILPGMLLLGLLGALGLWWNATGEITRRQNFANDLTHRLNTALAQQAQAQGRLNAAHSLDIEAAAKATAKPLDATASDFVFAAPIRFQPGSATIDTRAKNELDTAIVALKTTIAAIPQGKNWRLAVESFAGEAGGKSAATDPNWSLAERRLTNVLAYMEAQDLPEDRFAARFHAGFGDPKDEREDGWVVEVKLLCCFE